MEGRRRSLVQILAVASGVFTAFLASSYIPPEVAKPADFWSILGLGLLASGGSGLWNSVLTYLTKLKDVKKAQAILEMKRALKA
jgi:CDP-diglyceride synthetase